MKNYIGIDIGKNGAIVKLTYSKEGYKIDAVKMPLIKTELDMHELNAILVRMTNKESIVVFEKLGTIFGSSKVTAFSMGHQSGAVEMACIANRIPFEKVRAVEWQKEMFRGVDVITKTNSTSKDTKAMALISAKRLFPDNEFTFKSGNKAHDGYVDALLIAEYAKRKNL